jgi:uncharacterized protein YgiM (DUF1202 family)
VLRPRLSCQWIATGPLTGALESVDLCGMSRTTTRAAAFAAVVIAILMLPVVAHGQRGRGQGTGAAAQAPPPTGERVRVKARHANIQTGPTSGNEVLVLAAKGTVLPVLARRGEWIQVGLSPDLRKSGMVMRWYKNENNGWVHDSMVDVVKDGEK